MTDTQTRLDQALWEFISAKDDETVFEFCGGLIPVYPVRMDLKHCVEDTVDFLENAMILYSGYQSEKFVPLAAAARQMIRQEVESGRWQNMPDVQKIAAGVIARRGYEDISKSQAAVEDPEKVYMVIGLYTYTSLVCAGKSDILDFIRLFVYSWLIYYSEILSISTATHLNDDGKTS